MNLATRSFLILLAAFMTLALPTMEGSSNGIHNQASNGCTCHYSGSAPTISQNFPSTYNGQQSYTIQISVTGGVSGTNGGFNVLVDKGTLSTPGIGIMAVKVDSSGQSATHTTNSYRSWSFDWTAPASGSGTVNVDIAVMTANGNSANSGDAWTTSSITVPEPGPTNSAPTASNVHISNQLTGTGSAITTAYYDEDLYAIYDYNDPDGDAESGTQIRWLQGSTTITQHNDLTTLAQSATSLGEFWTMTVTPSDGTDYGSKITSTNTVEIIDYDADGDGYGDQSDAFPNDENEWADADGDGVGDNADAFDDDATQTTDSDGDGYGDNASGNSPDAFPNDANEWADSDGDGVGDNADVFPEDANETLDSDGDDVGDNADAFPNDASETVDTDGDGVGDNSDDFPEDGTQTIDADGDGFGDSPQGNNPDLFPNDATQWMDSDNDGYGDNLNGTNGDVFPQDSAEWADSDGDGVGDNADAFPEDATETLDSDGDGMGDTEQLVLEAKQAEDAEEAAAQQRLMVGGGFSLLLIAAGGALFLRRRSTEANEITKDFSMPEFTDQPAVVPETTVNSMEPQSQSPAMPVGATVVNQWTDENGYTWRAMSDGTNQWWTGTDWQQI